MRVAFTGTRQGMNPRQRKAFRELAEKNSFFWTIFNHGSCKGADKDASNIVFELCASRIVAHPCNLSAQQAVTHAHARREVLDPIERNHVMVDESDILVAVPATKDEVIRSGTWATIRYAKKMGKEVIILYP